jgi:hypothetical protein
LPVSVHSLIGIESIYSSHQALLLCALGGSSRVRGLFHPHHRETECRINIVHSCLGSWVLDPRSSRPRLELTAAGTLPCGYCPIRNLHSQHKSRGAEMGSRCYRAFLYGAERTWEERIGTRSRSDVHLSFLQERIITKRRRAREHLPILPLDLRLPGTCILSYYPHTHSFLFLLVNRMAYDPRQR